MKLIRNWLNFGDLNTGRYHVSNDITIDDSGLEELEDYTSIKVTGGDLSVQDARNVLFE